MQTADEFSLQRYTDADRAGVFELLREAFSERYADHLAGIWDWKYGSHPLNRAAEQNRKAYRAKVMPWLRQTYSPELLAQWGVSLDEFQPLPDDAPPYILLLKRAGRIAAMLGALPQEFLIDGARHLVSVACDLAVHPNYRGSFLSMRLRLRLGAEHQLGLGWSGNSSRVVGANWRKRTASQQPATHPGPVGMRVVPLVKPIDWSYMVHRATGIGLPRSVARVMAAGAHRARDLLGAPVTMPGVDVFRLESFDHRIDELWERVSREHQVIGIRDRNYLNWRFNARPEASYQCLAAARGDTLVGYFIYRIVEQDGAPWGYIVDFLTEGDPAGAFATLLNRAEELMLREGVKSIVCTSAKASFRRILRRSGFYPAIFGEPSYMIGGITHADPRLNSFVDLSKWFVTMADGDAEMSLP